MYCTNCGYKNIDTAKFCKSCGANLSEQDKNIVVSNTENNITNKVNSTLNIEISENNTETKKEVKEKKSAKDKIKTIIIVIVAIATFPIWGNILSLKASDLFNLGNSQDVSNTVQEATPEITPAPNTVYIDDYIIEITEAFVDDGYLVVSYKFTNNSSSEASFNLSINNTCWQNGVEVSEIYYPYYDVNSDLNDVQPGASTTIYKVFGVSDLNSTVELTFEPLFNFTSNYSYFTIDLTQLEVYHNGNSSAASDSNQLCAAKFLEESIPYAFSITDTNWVLSDTYYNGGRFLTHENYPYVLIFNGGENPTFTETITSVGVMGDGAKISDNLYIGQTASEVMAINPSFSIETSELIGNYIGGYDTWLDWWTVNVTLYFDENDIIYRAEIFNRGSIY